MLYSRSMGRIIAIDYGRKRTGIAATDILQMIANGVATVPSGEVVKYLSDYISREPVDLFVVGLPKQMNNEPSENMKYVEAFDPSEKDDTKYPGNLLRRAVHVGLSS